MDSANVLRKAETVAAVHKMRWGEEGERAGGVGRGGGDVDKDRCFACRVISCCM